MRVLVTGHSGHVGGAIMRHLFERGCEVVGLSRRTVDAPPASVRQISADIRSAKFLDAVLRDVEPCDAIVHAAACLDPSAHNPDVVATNCLGTDRALELAERWRAQCFVFISGVAVIGKPRELPITEHHPCNPKTVYHATKLLGEHLAAMAADRGLAACSLRLSSPVGPGTPTGRLFRTFVECALASEPLIVHGQGARRQNYVDVRDAARAVYSCIERRATGLYNIGAPEPIANLELARQCVHALGSTSPITRSGEPDPDDALVWSMDISRARHDLNFAPEHTISDSIRALAAELRTA